MADHQEHGHAATTHQPGSTDIADHERMFASFIRFWVYVASGTIAVLIFLALFNS